MVRLVALLLMLAAAPAQADRHRNGGGDDHDRARFAREAGEVLPLSDILAAARAARPGRIIELDLEREDGRWIYELELISPDGRLYEMEIDAATGEILEIEREEDDD